MNFLDYLIWYMSMNSSTFFESTIKSLDKRKLLGLFNEEITRKITHYFYVDKIDDKIIYRTSFHTDGKFPVHINPNELCIFIGTGITLDNLEVRIPYSYTIFFLSSTKIPKIEVLRRWYPKIALFSSVENLYLLSKESSDEIKMMIFTNSKIFIKYTKKYMLPYGQTCGVCLCLLVIFICTVSIFFLICSVYATVNPIITEVELERFKVVKYNEIKDKGEESCLICFETYEKEDDIRILFCSHYFHKKCVDKWLCEQSSRCPYCRYANKYYNEI